MKEFEQVAMILPMPLREEFMALPPLVRRRVEEIRLRGGRSPTVVVDGEELCFSPRAIELKELERTLEIATRGSVHTALESVKQGYFTIEGGHRIGICGSVWTEEGKIRSLRGISSLNIRVAHAVTDCGAEVLPNLLREGRFVNTILLSPPGGGKTTLLRDLTRLLSNGASHFALRTGLADERGEVAALWDGVPQFDVGRCTDVLENCPKAQALLILLRGMNPQLLCCDEVTEPADCAALEQCANCGVKLLCTVHGESVEDLRKKPLYRELVNRCGFEKAVVLRRKKVPWYEVEELWTWKG